MSMNKLFALLLSLAMLTAVLASCNPQAPQITTPEEEVTLSTTTTTEPDVPVIPNGILLSSVKILTEDNTSQSFAAAELAWYLTQKNVTVVGEDAEDEEKENAYPITLSIDSTIAEGGYKIEAAEDGLTIQGGNERGLAYGVYNFLEKIVGIHFYAANTIVTDKKAVAFEWGVLDEFTPMFEILRNPWQPIEALAQKNGGNVIYHDNLFKTVTLDALVGKNGNTQPCLTSAENLANAIAYAKEFLAKSPALKTLTFAPAPGTAKNCTCNACAALDTEENTPTGAYIRFINAIIESVKADYPTLSFEIKMSGCFLSLPATERPADGVSVFMSTEECHATHPLTDADCPTSQTFVEALQAWSKITSVRLEYVLSATEYLSTFANLNTLRENMRLFAESGIDSLYCSGNFSCPSGEFGELRAYLINALLQNPTMSEEEYSACMNEFLATYYGDGWFYIRNYINKITELANNDVSENDACGQSATDSPLTVITRTEYRNYAYQFDNCWNAAEQLAGDRIEAVKGSRIQWQYIQVCLNPNEADAQALINAVSAANLCWRKDLRSVSAESSLTLAPTSWKYAQ